MNSSDLHICRSSHDSNQSSCACPPEYYCSFVCDEGYSLGTDISWQHFPRSTSDRGFCDSSSEDVKKHFLTETESSEKPESPLKASVITSTEYPIKKSEAQLDAQHYLEIRHVHEFFNFLLGHLVCNEPKDPINFLVDLLNKCLKYRDSFGEPPLLFSHFHVKSLYSAFDPFQRGYITFEQYEEAMNSMGLTNGITPYNRQPSLNEEGFVTEDFFTFESERCLAENLIKMLRVPYIWEENRLKWNRKLKKEMSKTSKLKDAVKASDEIEDNPCKCSGTEEQNKLICKCSEPVGRRNSSAASTKTCKIEQMFL